MPREGNQRLPLVVWAAVVVLVLAARLPAEEPLPAELAAKVKELAPDGTVRRAQLRERRGENAWRVDLTLPGDMNGRIELKPDGTLVEVRLELTADQLPEPVKKAVAELYPKATFDNADRNLNDGQLVIDVEYKQDGRTLTATLADDGKVLDREDEIALAELPAAAQAALAKDFPGATLTRIRRVMRNGAELFEVRAERRLTVTLPDPAGSTTTTRDIPAADLPEATRAAAAAATGRDPAEMTIVQHTTSPVTVYEIQLNDRRDLQFSLEGVLLNPPAAAQPAAAALAPVQGQQPARGGNAGPGQPNGNNNNPGGQGNRGGRGNWQGQNNRGGNGGPGGQRGPERPARDPNPAPQDKKDAPPPEEVF